MRNLGTPSDILAVQSTLVSPQLTRTDPSGCLVNASGILALTSNKTVHNFIRYLFTKEVQSYLSSEAFEIPLVDGIALPRGIPSLDLISPPAIDLTQLSDLRPTLDLMRELRVL